VLAARRLTVKAARALAGALALSVTCALPRTGQTGGGTWITRKSMPLRKSECAAARLGGRIYVAGGLDGAGVKEVFTYSPAKDAWDTVASMPVGLHHLHLGAMDGKLYVLGGCDHGRKSTTPQDVPWLGSRHAFVFDTATGAWRKLKPLPHSTGMGGIAAFGGRFYVIGGVDTDGVTLDLVQEYNPADDTWRMRAPMPTPREHIGIAVLDSLIYVVAGRPKGLNAASLTAFEAYSPASDKWYVLPDLPTARSGAPLAAAKGRLYALGGEWPGIQTTNEEYDPVKAKWRTVQPLPLARHGFGAVVWGDTVYAFGFVQATHAFIPPGPATAVAPGAGAPRRAELLSEGRDVLGRQRRRRQALVIFHRQ
jgi:N-acetylneuraminic acid mutarotase